MSPRSFGAPVVLPRWGWIATFVALIFIVFFSYKLHVSYVLRAADLNDFKVYLEASQRLQSGKDIYHYVYVRNYRDGITLNLYYFYPPFLAAMLTPIADLSMRTAKFVWCLGGSAMLLVSAASIAALVRHTLFGRYPFLPAMTIALSLVVCFEPTYWGSMEGQVDPFILGLVACFLAAYSGELYVIAGAALALAALIKVSPALLLLLPLRQRRWKVFASFFLVVIGFALALIASPAPFSAYSGFMAPFQQAAAGTLERNYLYNFAFDRSILELFHLDTVPPLRGLLKVLLLAVPAYCTFRRRIVSKQDELQLGAILIVSMILCAPTIWAHHLAWLIIPIILGATLGEYRGQMLIKHLFIYGLLFMLINQVLPLHAVVVTKYRYLVDYSAVVPGLFLIILIVLLARMRTVSIEPHNLQVHECG